MAGPAHEVEDREDDPRDQVQREEDRRHQEREGSIREPRDHSDD
jgi:hypothetical protein